MALKGIVGQEKAVSILLRTIERGRVPSAYLFAGESGIGKRFAALNLAKALNCLKHVTSHSFDACDECPSCRKIDSGTHPDVLVIIPEKGEIRVGEIRAVEEALSLRPFEGRRKVVIIDDADAMNQSAANAFLKTLEEPPEESLLILVTAHPGMLPETVRSRCSRINFVPLHPRACEEVITSVLGAGDAAGKKKTPAPGVRDLADLVRLSMGRPGLTVSSDMIRERERFIGLLGSMLEGGSETWADREEMERWFDMALTFFRDMAAMKIAEDPQEPGLLMNDYIKDSFARMTAGTDIRSIVSVYHKMNFVRRQMGFNLNKAITWNYTASVVRSIKDIR